MKNNVTIKDIANELNLSATAVSRALRNMPDISEETRKKVREQAKKMNYSKNYLASTLRTRSSNIIGLIMDIRNPVYTGMYQGIEDVCKEEGYIILFSTSNERAADEWKAIEAMYSHQVDGIILCPTLENTENIKKLRELGIPFVLIGRTFDEEGVHSVVTSDLQGGYLVCSHLLSKDYKTFLYMTVPLNCAPAIDRYKGFCRCMEDNGIPHSALTICECLPTWKDTYSYMKNLLDSGFRCDAVFTFNDVMATGVLKCLNEHSVKVPEEIAVIGYDNIDSCELAHPGLSTVDILAYRQGHDGMTMLLDLLHNKEIPADKHRISYPPNIVIRHST